jgi:26S proteasome regulatory subunit N1
MSESKESKAISVESKDAKDEKDDQKKIDEKAKLQPEELSEEDQALKDGLELAVLRLGEDDSSLHKQALEHLIHEIRSSTSSMTAVPKPLKFLRPHYERIKNVYQSWPVSHELKRKLSDVLSVLAMTMADRGSRESLKYKLRGTPVDIASWGHEYVRSLAGEISEEYNQRMLDTSPGDDIDDEDLMLLVDDILPFQMQHNAEAEAVDMLVEVQKLHKLLESPAVDEKNYQRVCLYLIRLADFMSDPDDLLALLNTAFSIYINQKKYIDALRVAIRIDDDDKVQQLFAMAADSDIICKQMAFMLGRHRSHISIDGNDSLNEVIGNTTLSDRYLQVGRSMDLLEAKSPDDIYKTHLITAGPAARRRNNPLPTNPSTTDSARANLASSFVNAFVNAGFNKDKLMTVDDTNWVFKNKDHGMISAVASMGMILLWNVDEGFNQIDKYFHQSDEYIRAGACLGVGIVSSGVRNESDPALAILSDYIDQSHNTRVASIMGLGIAYVGTRREDISELLVPIASNTENANIVEVSFAALSLGFVFVGTCNDEIGGILVQRLMEATEEELNHTMIRFLCLGLGLLYLGKIEKAEVILEAVRTVEHKTGKYAEITLETCAYAGTGNVLKVQQQLRTCAEHLTENAEHQLVAALGIALISAGEDISTEMTLRTFDHLQHYCELPVKRVIPLALALLYISNPDYNVIDQLSRLSHDQDTEISQCAILGLGLVCAGTNNSRVAGLLRQLSDFYSKEANHLFIVRISQGLNSMGKGLLSLSPFHSDRLLMNGSAFAGILAIMHASLDIKSTLLDKYHFILYYLATAMNPRYLVTVDTDLNPLAVNVRVGQAVETVGQAGRPKTITGFQVCSYSLYLTSIFYPICRLSVDSYDAGVAGIQRSCRASIERLCKCHFSLRKCCHSRESGRRS